MKTQKNTDDMIYLLYKSDIYSEKQLKDTNSTEFVTLNRMYTNLNMHAFISTGCMQL